jgi:DNA-binding NarL/FixJ family response regulator
LVKQSQQSPQPERSFTEPNHLHGGQGSLLIRVLVVDDHEPFRRFVRETLNTRPELQIISESSDGLEAVQKAAELQPGLIVLDIGLPSLNGIEAARRIRKLSPQSKILFLTQESSAAIAQEAISLGALGFVIKAQAARDLSAALEAVLRNEQFISSTLKTVDG